MGEDREIEALSEKFEKTQLIDLDSNPGPHVAFSRVLNSRGMFNQNISDITKTQATSENSTSRYSLSPRTKLRAENNY